VFQKEATKLTAATPSNLNRFSKFFHSLPCKIQPLKIVVEKYSSNDVTVIYFADEKIYRATHGITDYAAAATKKKGFAAKSFRTSYQRSVTVSDGVSWQVKIGLHQFDNCLSQSKSV